MPKKAQTSQNTKSTQSEPNHLIIDNFKKLIKLLEFITVNLSDRKQKTINQYRIASLKKSLKIISKYDKPILSGKDLQDIPGIGKGTINRIDEILKTTTLNELANFDTIINQLSYRENIISDLMTVVGIGRNTAIDLINKYKVKSASELKKLSDTNQIELNDKLKLGLKYLGKFVGMIPHKEIDKIYDYLQIKTNAYSKNMFITICGSYRRELPTSSDIDILLSDLNIVTETDINSEQNSNTLSDYVKYLHQIGFLLDDITNKNIQTKYMGFGQYKNNPIRRVDIRLIPMISYFPALLYFTGSYEFNQQMRSRAKKLGYKLNEYGLYSIKTNDMIPILSEQEMFSILKMEYLRPNQR